ncbi:hypothetical protein ACFV6B_13275 [Streptomyces microflavus]|uniref:hypothetical protein n=1 Tax=Streptomyces microflavus TaxID=1919 RepID=UPI003668BB92
MTDTDRALALAAGAAVVLAVCAGWVLWRLRAVERVLRRERAAVLLTDAAHYRDMEAFRRRLARAVADQAAADQLMRELAVVEAADAVVTAELARTTHHNPQEGDTP